MFFIRVDADDAGYRGGDPDLPDVPRARRRTQARHESCVQRVKRSLGCWLLKGCIDDIRVVRRGRDGRRYKRLQAFRKVVRPQGGAPASSTTAIVCMIFAVEGYASRCCCRGERRRPAPPVYTDHHRRRRQEAAVAAGRCCPDPSIVFTVHAAQHLLRGHHVFSEAVVMKRPRHAGRSG